MMFQSLIRLAAIRMSMLVATRSFVLSSHPMMSELNRSKWAGVFFAPTVQQPTRHGTWVAWVPTTTGQRGKR